MVLCTVPADQAPASEARLYFLAVARKSNWPSDPHPTQSVLSGSFGGEVRARASQSGSGTWLERQTIFPPQNHWLQTCILIATSNSYAHESSRNTATPFLFRIQFYSLFHSAKADFMTARASFGFPTASPNHNTAKYTHSSPASL